jgi:hypothetical protein
MPRAESMSPYSIIKATFCVADMLLRRLGAIEVHLVRCA